MTEETDAEFLKRMADGRDVAYSIDFTRLLALAHRGAAVPLGILTDDEFTKLQKAGDAAVGEIERAMLAAALKEPRNV